MHKLGYAPKGASVLVHRTKELRRYQTFVFDDWLGGFYASPGHAGQPARPADGDRVGGHAPARHRRLPAAHRVTIDATRRLIAGVRAIPELACSASPTRTCSRSPSTDLDVFALGDALHRAHWHLDRQKPPDSLHVTVSAGNAPIVDEFLRDLRDSVAEVGGDAHRRPRHRVRDVWSESMSAADDVRDWEARGRRLDRRRAIGLGARHPRARRPRRSIRFSSCTASRRARSTGATCSTRSARDRRVVALDFLGFGLSDKPDVRYSMRLQADMVEGVAPRSSGSRRSRC